MSRSRPGSAEQLPLGLGAGAARRFATFEPGANAEALAILRHALVESRGGPAYLWGAPGSGKTHLLEASCAELAAGGATLAFVPLGDLRMAPDMLSGLASVALVAVDDVERIAGDPAWEEALFHLYNQAEQGSTVLLLGAARSPRQIAWGLADLASRLAACTACRVRALDDAGRARALKRHAHARGFELGDEVIAYVLSRLPRDMPSLMALLDRLDRASLSAQRRVTLPFVKTLLEGRDA